MYRIECTVCRGRKILLLFYRLEAHRPESLRPEFGRIYVIVSADPVEPGTIGVRGPAESKLAQGGRAQEELGK